MFTEPFVQEREMPKSGWAELICGPMFSGKTEELMRRLRRAEIAGQKITLFKPSIDTRYDKEKVVSHDSSSMQSMVISSPEELLKNAGDSEVIGIDEIQFFNEEIVAVVNEIADSGKRVIMAGLDKDYLGVPFGPVPGLMATSEFVTKLHAICMVCGGLASFSYRLADSDSKIELGAGKEYQARCRKCFTKHQK